MKSNSITLIWFRWQIENQSGVKQIQRVTLGAIFGNAPRVVIRVRK